MKKVFEPKQVEKKWYSFWENNNLFSPKTSSNKKTFSIMLPPPNVTGSLHMGHGFQNTLMDVLSRYKSCLLYTSPSPRDDVISRMPSSA